MAYRVQVVIDCADPARLAGFWAAALGYVVQPPPDGFDSWPAFLTSIGVPESAHNDANAVVDPSGAGPRVFFQRVPEPKTGKNRVHVDVNVGPDHVDAEVERLVGLGATVLARVDKGHERWVTLADPEGNELCLQ